MCTDILLYSSDFIIIFGPTVPSTLRVQCGVPKWRYHLVALTFSGATTYCSYHLVSLPFSVLTI